MPEQYQKGETVMYLGERFAVEGYAPNGDVIIRQTGMMFPKVLSPHNVHRPEPSAAKPWWYCIHGGNNWKE